MTRPVRPAGRTRTINTLLALIMAACLGVIVLDQTGKFGDQAVTTSGEVTPAPSGDSAGITVPNLGPAPTEIPPTTAPDASTSDTSTPGTQETPDTSTEQDTQDTSASTPTTSTVATDAAPTSTPPASGYGDLK